MRLNAYAILLAIAALFIASPLLAGSGYQFENFTIPTLSEDRNGNGLLDDGEDYNNNGVLDLPTNVSLFDHAGSIIIIDFFAYWCGPCIIAAPKVQADLFDYYASRLGNPHGVPVIVWGISMQGEQENLTKADIDQNTYGYLNQVPTVSYPIMMDYDRVAWGMTGASTIPHLVIINGIPNDPNYLQWEVLYGESGYSGPDTIRGFVDSIIPSTDPLLNFEANQKTYFPGDSLSASLNLRYYGQTPTLDLYAAIMAFGQIIFYPSWGKTAEPSQLIVAGGYNEDFVILNNIPISTSLPEGTYSLLSICASTGTYTPVSDLEKLDFNVSHQEKGSMKTYFKDNPVFQVSSGGKVPLTIYLENTGPQNITIDTFTIDTFDAAGNYQVTQDASDTFPAWFGVTNGVLTVGLIADASLEFGNPNNLERQAQFYFHGIDANGGEVEVTSEKLIMKPVGVPGN